MDISKRRIYFLCAAALALLFCGCSAETKNGPQSVGADQAAVTVTATFQHEGGAALAGDTIRVSDDKSSADYALDENGALVLSGIPKEGELTVTVLDGQAQPQETIALSFSQGSVIDVVSDGDGTGHVTLKEDTEEVALSFTLCEDSSIRCDLQLHGVRIV